MIEAIKRLVAAVEAIPEEVEGWMPDALTDALIEARQTIAEAEKQEPVAFRCGDAIVHIKPPVYENTHPQPKREPAIDPCKEGTCDCCWKHLDEQEPVAGKGKELSEKLKLCARNVAFVAAGKVDMSSAAMQEMFSLIDHVCVGIDSPPVAHLQPKADHTEQHLDMVEQEPDDLTIAYMSGFHDGKKKREWVGLTDEDDIDWDETQNLKQLVEAVEAKLKEKNT